MLISARKKAGIESYHLFGYSSECLSKSLGLTLTSKLEMVVKSLEKPIVRSYLNQLWYDSPQQIIKYLWGYIATRMRKREQIKQKHCHSSLEAGSNGTVIPREDEGGGEMPCGMEGKEDEAEVNVKLGNAVKVIITMRAEI